MSLQEHESARESDIVAAEAGQEDKRFDVTLRPSRFDDFVGQDKIKAPGLVVEITPK